MPNHHMIATRPIWFKSFQNHSERHILPAGMGVTAFDFEPEDLYALDGPGAPSGLWVPEDKIATGDGSLEDAALVTAYGLLPESRILGIYRYAVVVISEMAPLDPVIYRVNPYSLSEQDRKRFKLTPALMGNYQIG